MSSAPILVLGGGAAGIFAAIGAAEMGAPVVILEKKHSLGLKLLMTGNGRCNLTNTAPLDLFIQQFAEHGPFLYSALNNLSNMDLMNFFAELGVELKEERGGRVFPVSDRSKDVLHALTGYLHHLKVQVKLNTRVAGISTGQNRINGVFTEQGFMPAGAVILATGGLSYPRTGSTGDGYQWARELGHTVTPLRPSLVPLETVEDWVKELRGLSLQHVQVTAWSNHRKVGEQRGEMLFTHFGVSGPAILNLSRNVVRALANGPVKVLINLRPGIDRETQHKQLSAGFQRHAAKHLKNALVDLLPQRLIKTVTAYSNLPAEKPVHQLTRMERQRLCETLQGLPLTISQARPIEEAMVTSGGINLKEVNPKTMASKLIANLYFAGEILDIDGFTGGFNLQAAFSTGYLAGQSAAVSMNKTREGGPNARQ
ncbi:MAG TPA: NAD(P)/FAD-dependent oxidoreductase [Clostridia bacterium]|nr:NAD(P)/FAD-dependent oxidoreductase [Clostridia bacterium]